MFFNSGLSGGTGLERALERFGGNSSALFDVLRVYTENTPKLMKSLREYLDAGNLADYAIVVHGIKGSSYGIYADETGKTAEELEALAKAGDISAVKARHPAFSLLVDALLAELDKAVGAAEVHFEGLPIAAEPDLELLRALRDACARFDMDAVDALMEKLERFRYEKHPELIEWLRIRVSDMRFEEIAAAPWLAADTGGHVDFTAPDARVLIVDDNETNLVAAAGLLKPLKMRIDTADSGEAALSMLSRSRYDLILLDYMMPVMDGLETLRRIRRADGGYRLTVPVIALTAASEAGVREMLLREGMNDFIEKPINVVELRLKIRQLLPKRLLHIQHGRDIIQEGENDSEPRIDLPHIDGIDTQAGMQYSGTKKLYLSLLGNFYKLIDIKASKIEKCLEDGMLRDVAIEAHALKNTARMIGAAELSEGFGALEQYGNTGDRNALERETPAVLARYRALKPLLRPYGEACAREKKPSSPRELIFLLRELIKALDVFDQDTADEAMRRLEELRIPEVCAEQMELLRAYAADVAMQETMDLAETMIGVIEKIPEDSY